MRALATHPSARGLNDDVAILKVGGETLILTHDTMVEEVHFLANQDMADIAWKLVATNLSDLAAKGAKPLGVLLSYTLGADDARFVAGLKDVLEFYSVILLGGDTVSGSGARTFGMTAIGTATHTPIPSRNGAKPDDRLFITGPVGAAMIGFETLRDRGATLGAAETAAFCRPIPLLAEGQALAPVVTAIMDVSDGLLLDCSRLAKASGVTIDVDTASVPIAAPDCRRDDAIRWGDDYQLLFTANQNTKLPVPAHAIGTVSTLGGSSLLIDGKPPKDGDTLGYSH
ncbi:thiamine-phosphate kinase [Pontixanthobacter gangjinensis]